MNSHTVPCACLLKVCYHSATAARWVIDEFRLDPQRYNENVRTGFRIMQTLISICIYLSFFSSSSVSVTYAYSSAVADLQYLLLILFLFFLFLFIFPHRFEHVYLTLHVRVSD